MSLKKIFWSSQGLRAGWGAATFILTFAILVAGLGYGLLVFMRSQLPSLPLPGAIGPQWALPTGLGEFILLLATFGATLAMSAIERRPFSDYGFALDHFRKLFGFGALWGFALLSLLLAFLFLFHAYSLESRSSLSAVTALHGIEWALIAFLFGLTEESLFRGYLQAALGRSLGFWWASLITSAFFAMAHFSNQGEAMVGLLAAGAAGFVLCFSIWKTGSIWWAVGWHAAWNWGESFFYGTPNSGKIAKDHFLSTADVAGSWWSGGSVGPEGSPLIWGALILTAVVVWRSRHRGR